MEFSPISQPDLLEILGQNSVDFLADLRNWLYDIPVDTPLICRLAPSLNTRSESELFGFSSPRFAVRLSLGNNCEFGFLNARQIKRFHESLGRAVFDSTLSKILSKHRVIEEAHKNKDAFQKRVERTPFCLADSILAPRSKHRTDFMVLQTLLSAFYGEDPVQGTPFLQHIEYGGGMCAQACCACVLMLMSEHVKALLGVAEISYMCRKKDTLHFLLGEGLSTPQMQSFLTSDAIGLVAFTVLLRPTSPYFAPTHRALIDSGFPVIVIVSISRLWAQPEFKRRNRTGYVPSNGTDSDSKLHSITVVGIGRSDDTLLINDPATFPFLEITPTELIQARPLDKATKAPRRFVEFLTVYPNGITLVFVSSLLTDTTLITLVRRLHDLGAPCLSFGTSLQDELRPMEVPFDDIVDSMRFILVNMSDDEQGFRGKYTNSSITGVIAIDTLLKIRQLCNQKSTACWYWIAATPIDKSYAISIWHADMPIHLIDVSTACAAIFILRSPLETRLLAEKENWYLARSPQEDVATDNASEEHTNSQLQSEMGTSVLSSCVTHGVFSTDFERLERSIRDRVPRCRLELFVFLESEIKELSNAMGISAVTAVDFLSQLTPTQLDAVSVRLNERFPPDTLDIIGLASFIPELLWDWGQPRKHRAVLAVRNVLLLASRLSRTHPIRNVELVGGTRFKGLTLKDGYLNIEFFDESAAVKRLLRRLRYVLRDIDSILPKEIRISVELEPGPLFVLRNSATLIAFVSGVLNCPVLRRRVGTNLDIAHWTMVAELVDHFKRRRDEVIEMLRQSIRHSHISGHHMKGHLGDTRMSMVFGKQLATYRMWLQLLREVHGRARDQYSGNVSLEFEAVRNGKDLLDSLADLERLLSTSI